MGDRSGGDESTIEAFDEDVEEDPDTASILDDIGDETADRDTASILDDLEGLESSGAVQDHRDDTGTDSSLTGGLWERARERMAWVFSPRAFGVRMVAFVLGAVLAGLLPLLGGTIATLIGIFLVAFLLGLVDGKRRYVETTLAGTIVGGLAGAFGFLALTLMGVGLPAVLLAAGSGGMVALSGTYFGRDLRDGLTRDL